MALIQTRQIQAIMTVPQRLSFSAQLSNCNLATSGFATKTIPQGAPRKMNIPKITIVHVIACSLNLHISYYCSSVFLGVWAEDC